MASQKVVLFRIAGIAIATSILIVLIVILALQWRTVSIVHSAYLAQIRVIVQYSEKGGGN